MTDETRPALGALLAPRSIAVVGANDRPGTYAGAVLANLRAVGYPGTVWGVNPNRDEAQGITCFPTVSDLPEPVDAVVVAIPAAGVPEVVADAAARGCGGAIVLSAGFAEVESGREHERRLAEAARAGGIPVCGPNGNGIVAVRARAPMWGDSIDALEPGRVALISQSGNVAVNALNSRRGIDFHTVVSTGNQAVCDAADWLAALAETEGVGSVAMFLEGEGEGPRLAAALAQCAERGVGVAILKVGASAAGSAAAGAHTGAVAGDHRVFRALAEEAGAAWAEDPHDLLELARCLAEPSARPSGTGGLAVLTCSGGDSGLAADDAERLGIELPPLAAETQRRLGELLPDAATIANPLDYTASIWAEVERLHEIALAVGSDPGIDQLLLFFDTPSDLRADSQEGWDATRDGLAGGALASPAAALLASTLPDLVDESAVRRLAGRGVPTIAGLRTALRCCGALRRAAPDPARLWEIAERAASDGGRTGDGAWLGEGEVKRLLETAGIPVPGGRTVADAGACLDAALGLGWPVALKLTGGSIRHKSELGALELGIDNVPDLLAAARRLTSLPAAEGAELLVERMAPDGVELLVAAHTEGVVPVLTIGLGGIWAEALDDVAIVPLPASPARVERALRDLRGAAALTGGRGREPVDVPELARVASRTGELLAERELALVELNPVIATPEGCVVVDALARRAASPPPA